MEITRIFDTGPVTALLTCNNYIFAGVGGNIFVYDPETKRRICMEYVLPYRNIHGIRKNVKENILCVFGEKCFRVIRLCVTDSINLVIECQGEAAVVEDWILDAVWLNESDQDSWSLLALAVSHNVILLWDTTTSTQVQRVDCVEKCILYCAHFIGTSWSDLILAAGTVFNQVILWSPGGATNDKNQREIMHALEGHQGVIFSINYHSVKKVMASVSDDRTIRLWSLTFPSDGQAVSDWRGKESSPLMTLYGHSARVWDIQLLDNVFVSVGEDATCLVWEYSGKIVHKFRGHKGKSIWSLICDKNEKFVVTGGGDASIRMWTLDDGDGQSTTVLHTLSIPPVLGAKEEDFARSLALPDMDTVLAMTNSGRLLKHSLSTDTWSIVYHDCQFSSYTVMAVSPQRKYVAIGNIIGIVKLFDIGSCVECSSCQLYQGKVFGLVWVDTDHLLTTGPEGEMHVLSVPELTVRTRLILPACKQRWASAGVLCGDGSVLVCGDRGGTVHCYILNTKCGVTPQLPVSSFAKIHGKAGVTDVCYHDNTVYTSGRDGQYRQWNLAGTCLKLRSSHRVMKGMDWIDRISVSETDTLIYGFHSSHFTLWSVGQNLRLLDIECGGGHRAWDCQLEAGEARFVYLKMKRIAVCDTSCHSRQVILNECLHGRELCDVQCLLSSRNADGVIHVLATCSEDTTVQLATITSNGHGLSDLKVEHILQGHLSTVKTLAVSRRCSSQVNNSTLTGASGGQSNTEDLVIFSGGGRAQIQAWKVKIDHLLTEKCVGAESDKKLGDNPREKTSDSETRQRKMCSYEHLACVYLSRERYQRDQSDPETRILCLTALCLRELSRDYPPTLHVVAAACSDSYVRLFGFDEERKVLSLLQQSGYHDNCVFKVSHILHESEMVSRVILISGASEGQIAFWDITKLCHVYVETITNHLSLKKTSTNFQPSRKQNCVETIDLFSSVTFDPIKTVRVHQSGLNSLHCYDCKDGRYLVASGGDDNCLTVTTICFRDDVDDLCGGLEVKRCLKNVAAHAAQITGVWVLSVQHVVSVSIDQRVCVWELSDSDDQEFKMIGCRYIHFSDISNMDVWTNGSSIYLYVCGQGLSVLQLGDS